VTRAPRRNPLVKIIFCLVQCCLCCIEGCLKFMNRQAYIQIALTGESFCASARRAFSLLFRNAARVAALRVRARVRARVRVCVRVCVRACECACARARRRRRCPPRRTARWLGLTRPHRLSRRSTWRCFGWQ
jgi:hypothetical protein